MADPDLIASWALTEADLRWVLSHVRLPDADRGWAIEWIDHNELGLAWELINECLSESPIERSPEVAERMERARLRMGSVPQTRPPPVGR